MMMKFLATTLGKVIAGVVVLLLLFGAFSMWTGMFSSKMESRVAKGQAEASIDSGAEAGNTISNLMEGDNRTKAIIEEGLEAIRNAPEAEKDDAADRALCRLALYQNTPRCVALRSE